MTFIPTLSILVGLPAWGKSTWVEKYQTDEVWISSDNLIEAFAKEQGKTYSDVFDQYSPSANTQVFEDAQKAIDANQSVIWDQTNLSIRKRSQILNLFPENYTREAIVFGRPEEEEWIKRLASRPGKKIPEDVIRVMLAAYQYPTLEEGFDFINELHTNLLED